MMPRPHLLRSKCLYKINCIFFTKILDDLFHILDQMSKAGIRPKFDPFIFHKTPQYLNHGLLTAFPKMDIRSAHELSMIKEALFLSERESVFPDPASPSHTARRRPPPAGGDTAPISRRC